MYAQIYIYKSNQRVYLLKKPANSLRHIGKKIEEKKKQADRVLSFTENVIKNSPLCCTQEVCFKIQTLFTIKHNIK